MPTPGKIPPGEGIPSGDKPVSSGEGKKIENILEKFEARDTQFSTDDALQLIQAGLGWAVAKHLDKFQGLNHQVIAAQLIQVGEGMAVAKHLDKFKDPTNIQELIRKNPKI